MREGSILSSVPSTSVAWLPPERALWRLALTHAVGLEEVRRAQVFGFIGLDHQLVHEHQVGIRHPACGLDAQAAGMAPILIYLHLPAAAWDAVGPAGDQAAAHLQK